MSKSRPGAAFPRVTHARPPRTLPCPRGCSRGCTCSRTGRPQEGCVSVPPQSVFRRPKSCSYFYFGVKTGISSCKSPCFLPNPSSLGFPPQKKPKQWEKKPQVASSPCRVGAAFVPEGPGEPSGGGVSGCATGTVAKPSAWASHPRRSASSCPPTRDSVASRALQTPGGAAEPWDSGSWLWQGHCPRARVVPNCASFRSA